MFLFSEMAAGLIKKRPFRDLLISTVTAAHAKGRLIKMMMRARRKSKCKTDDDARTHQMIMRAQTHPSRYSLAATCLPHLNHAAVQR